MRFFLILLFIIVLTSCKKAVRQNNEIIKIELARSGTWSDPASVIIIDSSLTYKYYGLLNHSGLQQKRKYYEGKISTAFWHDLNNKYNLIHFKTCDSVSSGPIIEKAHFFELIIHNGTKVVRILRVDNTGNDTVSKALACLKNSYKSVNLHQVDSPFRFETKLQDPPHPKLTNVKFPLPNIK